MNGYGRVWSEEKVKNELLKCIDTLQIKRMPTSTELKSLGRNDLHIKVSRTKKYSGWANHLGLERKNSETLKGQRYEGLVTSRLLNLGHTVQRMSTKYPYDLLVNENVKIDVKSGKAYMIRGESRVHSFGINKKNPTCDIYIILAIDEEDEIEKIFVIPSQFLKVVTMCIGKDSKYNKYIDRWDYVNQFTEFYERIV